MFRSMLRPNKQLPDSECIALLTREPRGVLSVLGDDSYPYGLPLDHWYCPENGRIYFHCSKTGHKLDAIRRHDKVSFCVCDPGRRIADDWALTVRSVIVFGRIRIIDDPDRSIDIIRRLSLKFTQDLDFIEEEIRKEASGVLCLELTPEHICGKVVREA